MPDECSTSLSKVDVNVISHGVAWIIHLHQPPIFSRAGYLERKFAFSCTWFAAVYVTHLCDDRSVKREFLRVDPRDRSVDRDKVGIPAAPLFTFQGINAFFVRHGGSAEMVPADPLE